MGATHISKDQAILHLVQEIRMPSRCVLHNLHKNSLASLPCVLKNAFSFSVLKIACSDSAALGLHSIYISFRTSCHCTAGLTVRQCNTVQTNLSPGVTAFILQTFTAGDAISGIKLRDCTSSLCCQSHEPAEETVSARYPRGTQPYD